MEIVFLLVGLLFAFIGVYLIWDHIRFTSSARSVSGTVVEIEKRTTPPREGKKQGGPIYYPVIEYSAAGKTNRFTSKYGMSIPQYEIGEKIPLLYSRKKEEARIRQKAPYIFGGIFAVVGATLCVIFFNIFKFTLWSIGIAGIVLVGIFNSMRSRLNRHDISTLDEFLEAFKKTDMKTSQGTEPEISERITSNRSLREDQYETSKSSKWVGPIFTLCGFAILALGIYLGMDRADFIQHALRESGEVVSINSKRSDDGYVYYPVVEYALPGSKQPIRFEHDVGSNPASYSVGENVPVLYHPDDPSNAIIDEGVMNWFGPGLMFILGLIFASAGIFSIHHWRKIRTSKPLSSSRFHSR